MALTEAAIPVTTDPNSEASEQLVGFAMALVAFQLDWLLHGKFSASLPPEKTGGFSDKYVTGKSATPHCILCVYIYIYSPVAKCFAVHTYGTAY